MERELKRRRCLYAFIIISCVLSSLWCWSANSDSCYQLCIQPSCFFGWKSKSPRWKSKDKKCSATLEGGVIERLETSLRQWVRLLKRWKQRPVCLVYLFILIDSFQDCIWQQIIFPISHCKHSYSSLWIVCVNINETAAASFLVESEYSCYFYGQIGQILLLTRKFKIY